MRTFFFTLLLALPLMSRASEISYVWENDGNNFLKCYEKFFDGYTLQKVNGGKPVDESKCGSKKELMKKNILVYAWEDNGKHFLKCYEKFFDGYFSVRMNGGNPIADVSKCGGKEELIKKKVLVYEWEEDGNKLLKCYEKFFDGYFSVRMNGGKPIADVSKCDHFKTDSLNNLNSSIHHNGPTDIDDSGRKMTKEENPDMTKKEGAKSTQAK